MNLVYIDEYDLLGSEYYWNNHEKMNITKNELIEIGITDSRILVHKDLIPPLQSVNEAFLTKGMRLYVKEGYRSKELYELAFRKRVEKFGEKETSRLMNVEDTPHTTGRTVDVTLWDHKENKEIEMRNKKDDPEALFMDFYREKTDSKSKRYQELQHFMITTMIENGFQIGKLREYFHFSLPE